MTVTSPAEAPALGVTTTVQNAGTADRARPETVRRCRLRHCKTPSHPGRPNRVCQTGQPQPRFERLCDVGWSTRAGARTPAQELGGGPDAAALRDAGVDALFRHHYAGLLRLAYCLLGDRARAEDVVQDAFISIYAHWDGLREAGSALAYLRSAVIFRSRSRLRERFREVTRGDLVFVEAERRSSEDEALAAEENERLAAAVRTLPRRQREVVVCRYYLELSVAETAGLLEISDGSVKRHAHRGIEQLNARMGGAS